MRRKIELELGVDVCAYCSVDITDRLVSLGVNISGPEDLTEEVIEKLVKIAEEVEGDQVFKVDWETQSESRIVTVLKDDQPIHYHIPFGSGVKPMIRYSGEITVGGETVVATFEAPAGATQKELLAVMLEKLGDRVKFTAEPLRSRSQ